MKAVDIVSGCGHRNILATNESTFEITRDATLTKRGNCIVAVRADKSLKDLDDRLKDMLAQRGAKLTIIIQADDQQELIEASGSRSLTFSHPTDIVVRRSSYVCGRTLAITASKAASDFSRQLVASLRNPQQEVTIELIVNSRL